MAGKDIDIRLSTVPVQSGHERIVMRILEKSNTILKLERLGFHGQVLQQLDELTAKPPPFSHVRPNKSTR